eukprot:4868516-Pyramimonas_sp.AAC.1
MTTPNASGSLQEKATYTTDGGRQKRIDYIATSKQYLQGTTSVETLQDFDTGTIAKDHVPVIARTSLLVEPRRSSTNQRRIDRVKLQDRQRQQLFCDHLSTLPLHRWETDANKQMDEINCAV